MIVLRQSCKKDKDDEDDENDGLDERGKHVPDRFAHGFGGIKCVLILHAGREMGGQPVQFGNDQAIHFECVGARKLGDTEAYGLASVEHQVRAVIFGAKFGPADILQANQCPVGVRLQNDVFELGCFGEPPDGAHADLKFLSGFDGRLAHLPGGDVNVLLLQRADRVGRGQSAAGHAHRIQPEPHGIFAFAEDDHVRNPGHALQRVFYVDVQVVAHEERRVAPLRREDGGAEHKIAGGLDDGDAGGFDRVGQPSLGRVDAILNVNRGQIGIAVEVKSRGDRAHPVAAAGRGDVLHPFGAVDLLLERHGHRGFHGLGAGSDVNAGHGNLRRRQGGKLRNRQGGNHGRACQDNQQRTNRGEDRPFYEEINEHSGADLGRRTSDLGLQTSDSDSTAAAWNCTQQQISRTCSRT